MSAPLTHAPAEPPVAAPGVAGPAAVARSHPAWRRVGRVLLDAAATTAVVLITWTTLLAVFDVSPYVGKGPAQVWEYLVTDADAGEHRTEVLGLLGVTLTDASIGFVVGMAAALVLAAAIVLSRTAEGAIMPVAMLLRSVPLIALAPIIVLLVGRGVASVAVMSGIVVLFPALVTIVLGLRSASPQMRDVVTVLGGGPRTVLRLVQLPAALPAVFAAVRISVPGAVTGALIAEWLATGGGIGYGVVSAVGRAQNTKVWALVVVVTLASLVLYTIAQLLEQWVLERFGPSAGRA
ncbi:ABC transporter permease [Cellulomonas xiejunii]|uniref:ABC transporter permease n=1 Tax=Cellulomonas xiejunii TaxID=2968083 RepID=UPI001D0EFC58|nr:ABC transporter permease subunit [Cellulomonas xiejunii]MCC2315474.1 ABC transporter permease subunit [Cellulomonas xiejunii]